MRLAILFFSFWVFSLFSSPIGNPLNPEIIDEGFFIPSTSWLNFRLGYEGNFVSDARMEKSINKEKIDNFKEDVNAGTFTLNFRNRFDAFAVLGESRIRSDWVFNNLGTLSRIEIESNYRLYWAAGGKVILFQWGNLALATGGRYSQTKPSLTYITQDGFPQDRANSKVAYKSWQIDVGLAYKIDIFIPYLGAKYLRTHAEVKNTSFAISDDNQNELKMKNRDKFGIYPGCSLSNSKYFMLTVEARFIDEEGVSVLGEIKF